MPCVYLALPTAAANPSRAVTVNRYNSKASRQNLPSPLSDVRVVYTAASVADHYSREGTWSIRLKNLVGKAAKGAQVVKSLLDANRRFAQRKCGCPILSFGSVCQKH